MFRWLLVLLLMPVAPALSADTGCPLEGENIATLDAELLSEHLFDPRCHALAGPLADRAELLIAEGAWADDIDAEGLQWLLLSIAGLRTRIALHEGDIYTALNRLDDWEAIASTPLEDEDATAIDEDGAITSQARALRAILQGAQPPPSANSIAAPQADWVLYQSGCGMGAAMFLTSATSMPSAADAWLARKEPELALQSLLQDSWIEAWSYGMTPPRLRELVERAWGPGVYEREVERALQQIEIEWTPQGRVATMPLFGLRLPLPLGTRSWQEESIRWLDSESQLVDFMRSRLLNEPASVAAPPD